MHYDSPSSIESFSQESGRCGRDGKPSHSLLYTSTKDLIWAKKVCKSSESAKLQSMIDYSTGFKCRRRQMLSYFEEKRGVCDASNAEQLCDICQDAQAVRALSAKADRILAAGFLDVVRAP